MAEKAYWIVLISLILVISISSLAVAQSELVIKEVREEYGSTPEEKSGLTPIETHSDNESVVYYTPPHIPAPQDVIDKANERIISIMGKDYFAEHFELIDAKKLGSRYVPQNQTIEPTYVLTYNYTHDLKDEPYLVEYTFRQGVYLNGKFMNRGIYNGPKEPYKFSLTKSEVKQIAAENGMEEPIGVELYGYKWIARRPEEICTEKGKIERLDIHVDTGKILGKIISNGCATVVEQSGEATTGNGAAESGTTYKPDENAPLIINGPNEAKSLFQRVGKWLKGLFGL